MKKILVTLMVIFGLTSFSAFAGTNVGLKLTQANMEASGSTTTDSGSINSGGAAINHSAKDADFDMASIFVEKTIEDVGPVNIALGLDLIPFSAEIDKLGGGDGFDATVEVENVMTAYIQPMLSLNDNVTLFVKAGYTSGDVNIVDTSRQAGSASQTGDTQSTDSNTSKTLEGTMYGAGIQIDVDAAVDFVRLEGTFTDFDEISHTNSNSKVLKADSEMSTISLSLVKSF